MMIKADLHTHTLASDHAYCTINEMAAGAADAQMDAIGITDHGPALGDAPHLFYFQNLVTLPRKLSGVFLFRGAEVNILNESGEVDLPEGEMRNLDYTIASIHNPVYYPETKEEHTKALLNVMDNENVMILGHIGRCKWGFDIEKVLKKAKEKEILIEINNQSFRISPFSKENCSEIVKACKALKVPIVVNSDSHHSSSIGVVGNALTLLEEVAFPQDLIINTNAEKFINYLKKKGRNIECF